MFDKSLGLITRLLVTPQMGIWFARKILSRAEYGALTIDDRGLTTHHFEGTRPGPHPIVRINQWSTTFDILRRGDIGLGEAYRDKKIEIRNVAEFINWCCLNEKALKAMIYGQPILLLKDKILHGFNKNSKLGSRKNIQYHYDLGNSFYRLWLDKTKTYSSALFENLTYTDKNGYQISGSTAENRGLLEVAQNRKFDRILDQLQIQPQAHVLEVGCGWGAFLNRLMQKTQAYYHGITLSKEQYDYCQKMILENNWSSRARVTLTDYRDLHEKYDHIVSVEMVEAVGHEYWPAFVKALKTALRPQGTGVLQGITLREDLFDSYLRGTDFIQKYIFPGGMLLSLQKFTDLMRAQNLQVDTSGIFSFGLSYAYTLRLWAQNVEAVKNEILSLGFDEKFYRLWMFYLGYCEGAFLAGRINVSQIQFKNTP